MNRTGRSIFRFSPSALALIGLAVAGTVFTGRALADASSGDLARLAELSARPDKGGQAGIDLIARMARRHDLAALDWLIADVGRGPLLTKGQSAERLGWYLRVYQESRSGAPVPELEERVLAHYQEPYVGVTLLGSLRRYSSPALADMLVADVARYADSRERQVRQCRIVVRKAQSGPAAGSFGGMGYPQPITELRCPEQSRDRASAGEASRWSAAVRLVGNTDLNGIAARVAPFVPRLAEMPPFDPDAKTIAMVGMFQSRTAELQSIASAVERERYVPAAHDLVALLRKADGASVQEASAAWPLLKALAALGTAEALAELQRWIELRSRQPSPQGADPRLHEMIGLLRAADGKYAADIVALRDKVMANIDYRDVPTVSSAFRSLPALGGAPAMRY